MASNPRKLLVFKDKLRKILNNHHKPRPFVCDGNPYDCKVFIVGSNPVTEMEAEFWGFWNNTNGFNKEKWFESYITERASKPLKPGKTRRNKVSPTRQRIEWIVNSINPVSCLETNIYSKATPSKAELSRHEKNTSVFEFLLKELKPKIVFSHGVDARKYFESLSNSKIHEDKITEVSIFKTETKILAMPHLFNRSKVKTLETGQYLKTLCCNNQGIANFY